MGLSVRKLEATDRRRWEALFRQYLEFYGVAAPDNGLDAVWNWIFDPQNSFWCTLCVGGNGDIVGFVHYQLNHSSLSCAMTCYMGDLFVDPGMRGKGAGRLLIDHVLSFAKDKGLPGVEWLTADDNYAGRRLYDTYGPKTEFILYHVPL